MIQYSFIILNVINVIVNSYVIENGIEDFNQEDKLSDLVHNVTNEKVVLEEKAANAFDGVYSQCFLYLSYTCIQKKTLLYLNALNDIGEVPVLGDYVKFGKEYSIIFNKFYTEISKIIDNVLYFLVKINTTGLNNEDQDENLIEKQTNTHELSIMIDKAVNNFFDKHVMRINSISKDISVPKTGENIFFIKNLIFVE